MEMRDSKPIMSICEDATMAKVQTHTHQIMSSWSNEFKKQKKKNIKDVTSEGYKMKML